MPSVDARFNAVLTNRAEGFPVVTSGGASVASLLLRRSGRWWFFPVKLHALANPILGSKTVFDLVAFGVVPLASSLASREVV